MNGKLKDLSVDEEFWQLQSGQLFKDKWLGYYIPELKMDYLESIRPQWR